MKRKGMAIGGVVRPQQEARMPDTSTKNEGHIPGAAPAKMNDKDTKGPVPMRHRNRLGHEVVSDPQGEGMPSRESEINGRKNW